MTRFCTEITVFVFLSFGVSAFSVEDHGSDEPLLVRPAAPNGQGLESQEKINGQIQKILDDVAYLLNSGYPTVLVGEQLIRQPANYSKSPLR